MVRSSEVRGTMLELYSVICLASVAAAAVFLAGRLSALKAQMREMLSRAREQDTHIARLTERIWRLEQGMTPPERGSQPVPAPVPVTVDLPVAPPAPAVVNPPGIPRRSRDWETLVGTDWLSRLGALILVIGIVLFLGYSVTQMGPAGKLAIGVLVGVTLLGGGVALERQDRYRTWSFSLMAAGWAVLYVSAYAAHGIRAARVIESPAVGLILLLAVCAGMIAHSLRYRSEQATSLAYLLGFAGLNVSPLTSFSVTASLTLALSLLFVAYRFGWFRLPLLGTALTYLTFVLRYDPVVYGASAILNAQTTLWIYWIAFEAYDLLDLRRRGGSRGPERTLFLVNAAGFVGASLLQEWRMTPRDWSVYLLLASFAFLASTIIRARLTGSGASRPGPLEGGYEGSATLSALLMAGALIERFNGVSMAAALLFEAELVLLSGTALRSKYLQNLGAALLLLPVLRLTLVDIFETGRIRSFGLDLHSWTPVAVMIAAVLAFNRWLTGRGWFFSAGAALVLGIIAAEELPRLWVAPVFGAAGLALALTRVTDLRYAGYAALICSFARALGINVDDRHFTSAAAVTVMLFASHLLAPAKQRVREAMGVLGSVLLTAAIYREVPERLFTVCCGLEAAVLLAAGFAFHERMFRWSGLALFLVCLARLFLYDLRSLDTAGRILSFVVLGIVLLTASWVYTRFRDKSNRV